MTTTSDSDQDSDLEVLNRPIYRPKNPDPDQDNIKNGHLYGPLEVTGSFSYNTKPVNINDTDEIIEYSIKNYNAYDYVFNKKIAKEYLDSSIFTRIIRISLNNLNPIIGLIYVTEDRNSYYIAHLSVHEKFRRQGLAKTMLSHLAEFIKIDRQKTKYTTVNLMVNRDNTDAIALYSKIGFLQSSHRGCDIIMNQPIDDFIKITTFDILV